MKPQFLPGAALAVAALSLAIAGAAPAEARHHARKPKAAVEKHKCGGKNGCPAKAESKEDAPLDAKPADAKPAETPASPK